MESQKTDPTLLNPDVPTDADAATEPDTPAVIEFTGAGLSWLYKNLPPGHPLKDAVNNPRSGIIAVAIGADDPVLAAIHADKPRVDLDQLL